MTSNVHLDHLIASRGAKQAEASRLGESLSRLATLSGRVNDAKRALEEHDAAISAKMLAWARGGGEGDIPADHLHRPSLIRALAHAIADAERGGEAQAELTRQIHVVNADVAGLSVEIDRLSLDILKAEHAEFVTFARTSITPKLARLRALCAMLRQRGEQHQASGREDAARTWFARAEAAAGAENIGDVNPSVGEVIGDVPHWIRRFAELTSTPPQSVVVPIDLDARRADALANTRVA